MRKKNLHEKKLSKLKQTRKHAIQSSPNMFIRNLYGSWWLLLLLFTVASFLRCTHRQLQHNNINSKNIITTPTTTIMATKIYYLYSFAITHFITHRVRVRVCVIRGSSYFMCNQMRQSYLFWCWFEFRFCIGFYSLFHFLSHLIWFVYPNRSSVLSPACI